MSTAKIIAIGDNVVDKYLSRDKMYPGGQCFNTCAYAGMNGIDTAYLGKFGSDEVAAYNQKVMDILNIDHSHCRIFSGENGFALVTLKGSDRVFLGSNKGGITKEHPFNFTEDDIEYIKNFAVIYTNLNSYIEEDLPYLKTAGVPIAYDFSVRWNDEYLAKVCPYIDIALLSCAHLSAEARETEMKKVAAYGVPLVLGTIGEDGSYLLYDGEFFFANAVLADNTFDTMGAGDSYFATFLCSMLKSSENGKILSEDREKNVARIKTAMNEGAAFAARVCAMEGAFGYGKKIVGKKDLGGISMRPDVYNHEGEGISCVYKNEKWLVSIKNWKPDNDIDGIAHLEVHHSTDEQFILSAGKAILITADRENGEFKDINLTLMEYGKVYNVPKEMWFYSITQKDTKMMYVQDSNCSMENSDFADLTAEQVAMIQATARELLK